MVTRFGGHKLAKVAPARVVEVLLGTIIFSEHEQSSCTIDKDNDWNKLSDCYFLKKEEVWKVDRSDEYSGLDTFKMLPVLSRIDSAVASMNSTDNSILQKVPKFLVSLFWRKTSSLRSWSRWWWMMGPFFKEPTRRSIKPNLGVWLLFLVFKKIIYIQQNNNK